MKKIILFILALVNVNLFAQNDNKFNFEICDSYFQLSIKKIYPKKIYEHFKFNRTASYSYYSDYHDGHNKMIKYNDIDSLRIIPYQYVVQYDILDNNSDIITTLKVNCRCYDELLRIDNGYKFDEVLKPAVEVIEGKAITLKEAIEIANMKGYSINNWNIDYEKKKNSNDYKWFFPRLIWILKEKLSEENGGYYKVIQINARNGNIIRQYNEYLL